MNGLAVLAGAGIATLALVVIPLGMGLVFFKLSEKMLKRMLKHIIPEVLNEMGLTKLINHK